MHMNKLFLYPTCLQRQLRTCIWFTRLLILWPHFDLCYNYYGFQRFPCISGWLYCRSQSQGRSTSIKENIYCNLEQLYMAGTTTSRPSHSSRSWTNESSWDIWRNTCRTGRDRIVTNSLVIIPSLVYGTTGRSNGNLSTTLLASRWFSDKLKNFSDESYIRKKV